MADHNTHGGSHGHAEDNPAAHVDNVPQMLVIYALIAVGTIISLVVNMSSSWKSSSVIIHLAISTVQAGLVGYFWMHLRRADPLTWLTVGASIFFSSLQFILTLGDLLTRHAGTY